MVLPPHPTSLGSGEGRGPFGQRAFIAALVGCGVLVALGLLLVLVGSPPLVSVGASFLALGGLGLATSAAGLLAERALGRRPPPPPEVRHGNGHQRID
jgi:hypothetical protein